MSVQPGSLSSLVFLVVIAVWAAYFIQYWVRRREHLATARSVDQFSESMRVLERRSPQPQTDASAPQHRSYAVTPARAARPELPVESDRGAERPRGPAAGDRNARRTRALVLLGGLSTAVVEVALVALGLLPLLTLLVPLVSIVGALRWARRSTSAEHAARRADRQPVRHGAVEQRVAPSRATAAASQVTVDGATQSASLQPQPAADPVPRPELYDVQAVESADRAARAAAAAPAQQPTLVGAEQPRPVRTGAVRPLVDEDDIPLTWDPVPVPRPTYTMKSRVTRPAPAAADLVGDADTEYAALEDAPVRRFAGA